MLKQKCIFYENYNLYRFYEYYNDKLVNFELRNNEGFLLFKQDTEIKCIRNNGKVKLFIYDNTLNKYLLYFKDNDYIKKTFKRRMSLNRRDELTFKLTKLILGYNNI